MEMKSTVLTVDDVVSFSDVLSEMRNGISQPNTNMNEVMRYLSDRGPLAVICLLCLPFLFPMPLPGISTIFSILMCCLALGFLKPQWVYVPEKIGNRPISAQSLVRIVDKALPWMKKLELLSKVRVTWMLFRVPIFCGMVVSAAFLALPIPPVIPFTNSLPGIAIFLYAYGSLQRDGLIVLFGHVMLVVTLLYFYTIYSAIEAIFREILERYF